MEDAIRLAGIALILCLSISVIRHEKPEMALLVSAAGGLLLTGFSIRALSSGLSFFRELSVGTAYETYGSVLIRALGCSVTIRCTADLCRDAGESALASRIEGAGRVILLLMALPLVGDAVSFATELIR